MNRADFFYELPKELIAQRPLIDRAQARLLVVDRRTERITHDIFANLGKYLPQQSHLVLNDSKVIPARLFGRRERTGGKVEILLLKKMSDESSYQALLKPLGRLQEGEKIIFNGHRLWARVENIEQRLVSFNTKNLQRYLQRSGHMPLPPYIKREDEALDRIYYQTVYAKHPGSVAAPTAGLHFTNELLAQLKRERHKVNHVTLHVNHATFKPVQENDITKHKMHFEDYTVSAETFQEIQKSKDVGRPIVAVGTTSCRVLETLAAGGRLQGDTNLFIYPGFRFRMMNILITNFHLPYSTLLLLVYAFGGVSLMRRVYAQAVKEKYRFFSYGDAMLVR